MSARNLLLVATCLALGFALGCLFASSGSRQEATESGDAPAALQRRDCWAAGRVAVLLAEFGNLLLRMSALAGPGRHFPGHEV